MAQQIGETWWFLDGRYKGMREWQPWAEFPTHVLAVRNQKGHKKAYWGSDVVFRIVAGPQSKVEGRETAREERVPTDYSAVCARLILKGLLREQS